MFVEVDGAIHELQHEQDNARTEILNSRGFKVIRFNNEQVLGDVDAVVSAIGEELLNREEVAPSGARGITE